MRRGGRRGLFLDAADGKDSPDSVISRSLLCLANFLAGVKRRHCGAIVTTADGPSLGSNRQDVDMNAVLFYFAGQCRIRACDQRCCGRPGGTLHNVAELAGSVRPLEPGSIGASIQNFADHLVHAIRSRRGRKFFSRFQEIRAVLEVASDIGEIVTFSSSLRDLSATFWQDCRLFAQAAGRRPRACSGSLED